jgi:hypothetical protein
MKEDEKIRKKGLMKRNEERKKNTHYQLLWIEAINKLHSSRSQQNRTTLKHEQRSPGE